MASRQSAQLSARDKEFITDTKNMEGVDVAKESEFHNWQFMDSRLQQAIEPAEC